MPVSAVEHEQVVACHTPGPALCQNRAVSGTVLTGGTMATARARLWDVALDQYGYVTLQDAAELGIEDDTVRKLRARKELDRPAHGVYRFPQLPVTAYDPYMLAVLWTGEPAACLSHDSALAAYEVCD